MNFLDAWGLEAVDQRNIPNNLIDQNNPALGGIINMADSGCNFRACQNVAEIETGTALTEDQIVKAACALIASGAIDADMTVNDPDAVINDAFDRLGQPDTTATVGWGGEEGQDPDYTIMWGDTPNNSNPDGADHARVGDGNGNLLNDPYYPDIENMEQIYSNDVYLHK